MTPEEYGAVLAPIYRERGWKWDPCATGRGHTPRAAEIAKTIRLLLANLDEPMADGSEAMSTGTGRIELMRDEPGEATISLSVYFGEVER